MHKVSNAFSRETVSLHADFPPTALCVLCLLFSLTVCENVSGGIILQCAFLS